MVQDLSLLYSYVQAHTHYTVHLERALTHAKTQASNEKTYHREILRLDRKIQHLTNAL